MNKKLFVLICFLLVLETQSFPDSRTGGDERRKRPSGTNFLKRVLQNMIDRARKGLATPGDNELLMYLSSVPFLKDRICKKISTPSMEHSKSTLKTTLATESPAPTSSTSSTSRRLSMTTRGTTRRTTRGTTRGIKHRTTHGTTRGTKPKLSRPKISTRSSTEKPKMMFVDVDADFSDLDELEVLRKVPVFEEKSAADTIMLPTKKRQTRTGKLLKKTTTKSSKSGRPSVSPASSRPSKAPRPPSRQPSAATMKRSSVVETDFADTVVYLRTKRNLRNEDSRKTDENFVETLDKHYSWHNEEPSEENQPKRFYNGNLLETRADNSLDDKELEAIIGGENPNSSFNSKDFESSSGSKSESETTNSNIKSENENKSQEIKDAFNANENNGNAQTNKNMGEYVDEAASTNNAFAQEEI